MNAQMKLNDLGYFETRGLNVLAFSNWYDSNFSDANLSQYAHLGDASTKTDNLIYNPKLKVGEIDGFTSGTFDDRWAFTSKSTPLNYGSIEHWRQPVGPTIEKNFDEYAAVAVRAILHMNQSYAKRLEDRARVYCEQLEKLHRESMNMLSMSPQLTSFSSTQ